MVWASICHKVSHLQCNRRIPDRNHLCGEDLPLTPLPISYSLPSCCLVRPSLSFSIAGTALRRALSSLLPESCPFVGSFFFFFISLVLSSLTFLPFYSLPFHLLSFLPFTSCLLHFVTSIPVTHCPSLSFTSHYCSFTCSHFSPSNFLHFDLLFLRLVSSFALSLRDAPLAPLTRYHFSSSHYMPRTFPFISHTPLTPLLWLVFCILLYIYIQFFSLRDSIFSLLVQPGVCGSVSVYSCVIVFRNYSQERQCTQVFIGPLEVLLGDRIYPYVVSLCRCSQVYLLRRFLWLVSTVTVVLRVQQGVRCVAICVFVWCRFTQMYNCIL